MGCRCPSLPDTSPSPNLSAPTLAAASLELKAEKQSAHSDWVFSVAFSPDGKNIVSGSADKTIKVWDAGAWALIPLNATLTPKTEPPLRVAASLKLKAENENVHSGCINSVAFSPDGKSIVSGSDDTTLKVWDAGVSALTPLSPQPKSDRSCACGSILGAQGGEAERAQQHGVLRDLLP